MESKLVLYNTLSRRKEEFVPLAPPRVGMYVCGPTVYGDPHLGHARPAVTFDLLFRYLQALGYKVRYVRNITDVGHLEHDADDGEDKITKKARLEQLEPMEVAHYYTERYHRAMDALGVLSPSIEPRASGHIIEQEAFVQKILDAGYAYESNGSVYFDVEKYDRDHRYGVLSGRNLEDIVANTRALDGQCDKRNCCDFALWKKASPEHIMRWPSPWSDGFPGWHIECSAMSEKYIPLPLDIHGGGLDLIFPHHENEIAQTEAALGKPLANIWMHNGFVQVDSEKMSKSLGNFKTIRDILESYLAETLRYFLAGKHYRSPIDFSLDNMDESERSQKRVYECLREVDKALARENWKPGAAPAELEEELKQQDQSFMDALEDDVNTAAAMGHLFNMVRIAGRVLEDKKLRNSEGGRDILKAFRDATAKWDTLLGLFAQKPEDFLASLREIRARRRGLDMNKVVELLRERQEARAAKDFARSDAARDELAALGVEVRDTPEGPVWDII